MARVSVVAPTRWRPEGLDCCLAALLAQDIDPWDYEVIVADDDCVPAPGWLRAGLTACAPGVAGVMGHVTPEHSRAGAAARPSAGVAPAYAANG